MSRILTKEEFSQKLYAYYAENYGEKDTDEWYEQPAANVWVFKRGNQFVTLKAHILNGKVEEQIETADS